MSYDVNLIESNRTHEVSSWSPWPLDGHEIAARLLVNLHWIEVEYDTSLIEEIGKIRVARTKVSSQKRRKAIRAESTDTQDYEEIDNEEMEELSIISDIVSESR